MGIPAHRRRIASRCVRVAVAVAIAAHALAAAAQEKQARTGAQPVPAAAPAGGAGHFGVSTGFDWSTGKYGESQSTEVWYVPLNLRYEWHHWLFRTTVPYLRVTGPGTTTVGGGLIFSGNQTGNRQTRDGLGDVIAGVTYRFDPPLPWFPYLDATLKAKFPTASASRGLGTGEFDTTLQLDATKPFGALSVFGNVAYRFVGDPPGTSFQNTAAASIGIDWRIARPISVGGYYSWRQTASRSLGDAHEVASYASWSVGHGFTIGPYVLVGLSTAAPDVEAGLQLGFKH
jgi:hypothetical protein